MANSPPHLTLKVSGETPPLEKVLRTKRPRSRRTASTLEEEGLTSPSDKVLPLLNEPRYRVLLEVGIFDSEETARQFVQEHLTRIVLVSPTQGSSDMTWLYSEARLARSLPADSIVIERTAV